MDSGKSSIQQCVNLDGSLTTTARGSLSPMKHCMVFLTHKGHSQISCDVHAFCDGQMSSSVQLKFNQSGSVGVLFCCSEDLCNDESAVSSLHDLPSSPIDCKNLDKAPCSSMCMTRALSDVNPSSSVSFSCDTNHICVLNNVHPGSCKNITTKETICCCNTDECNMETIWKSDEVFTLPPAKPRVNLPKTPLAPMPERDLVSAQRQHWMFIGGIVAGVAMGTLLLIGIAVIIKKYQHHRDHQVSYTYTQLTADLAEERDTDDEYMLIG